MGDKCASTPYVGYLALTSPTPKADYYLPIIYQLWMVFG
jgi:hypothetical protein